MVYNIELDTYCSLTLQGVSVATFVGSNDDPLEKTISWKELIDREFEMCGIGGFDKDVFQKYDETDDYPATDYFDLRDIVNGLRIAADMLEDRLNDSYIFDRNEWLKSDQISKEEFLTKVNK